MTAIIVFENFIFLSFSGVKVCGVKNKVYDTEIRFENQGVIFNS
jgi:hypothetical protein